ncbi:hypothetical protein GCM10010420_15690 [Streptomyces glaucosporus]|uniref:Uncharacterized protein n=1 Tax=Streptomyces glaucosporus TaxID=284044 RepID=A0ABN3I0K4_9ACTN
MHTPTHEITAADADGRVFTVRLMRNMMLEPVVRGLACDHCDWRSGLPLSFSRTPLDIAGEHLATAHGADRGLSHSETPDFRRLRTTAMLLLPVVVVFLVMMWPKAS